MYPSVFAEFAKFQREYGDVSALPTPAFFYGLKPGEEISVSIEEGKVLFIKLINVGAPDKEGRRVISYELNGTPREALVADKSVAPKSKTRVKADANDPMQLGAPIPGMVTALSATVGGKVTKGDKLATLEAMKMQTTIYAPADGVIAEVVVAVGDSLEGGDLLLKLRS
jgi:pyruvate carboxylase